MNLLQEAWLPVRCRDGSKTWVRPEDLSRADLVAFAADRADFNGALAQFAIGLLQTCSPVGNVIEWRRMLKAPPDAATLRAWFEPFTAAFEFDGDGARFMQDFELRQGDGEAMGVGALLIDAAGENAAKNNSDLFIKRDRVSAMCFHCAALALFTLQLNAPSGGAGHRTGLRGGGPLTTLLIAAGGGAQTAPLWQNLWLNVHAQVAQEPIGSATPAGSQHRLFPWLAAIGATQGLDGQTTPAQVHPAQVFWAMPRRIRLDTAAQAQGTCTICGRDPSALITGYVTRNYGLNYKGAWCHPLSPYYEAAGELLPLHPQPDGLGYRHWLSWALGMQSEKKTVQRARVVEQVLAQGQAGSELRLWAFGYDMDNMKARRWYDATMPLYHLADCPPQAQQELREDVGAWLAGAELAASYLRGAVKDAWFSRDARGSFAAVDASFWSATEPSFYGLLRERIHAAGDGHAIDPAAFSTRWLAQLQAAALRLFDTAWVGTGPIERQNPGRIAKAHKQLMNSLYGPKLRSALALPIDPKPAKKRPAQAAATKEAS